MTFFLIIISGWIAFGLLAACVIGAGIHQADVAEQHTDTQPIPERHEWFA